MKLRFKNFDLTGRTFEKLVQRSHHLLRTLILLLIWYLLIHQKSSLISDTMEWWWRWFMLVLEFPKVWEEDLCRIWFLCDKTIPALSLPEFLFQHLLDLPLVRTCNEHSLGFQFLENLVMAAATRKELSLSNQWFCGAPVVLALSPAYVVPLTDLPTTSCTTIKVFFEEIHVYWWNSAGFTFFFNRKYSHC